MLEIDSIPVMYMVRNGDLVDKLGGLQKEPALKAFI
jgi:thioredoxin-like negative regulator of GroEL